MTKLPAPKFTLHKSACPENFWKDTCKDSNICNLLHIREHGKTLHVVNGCINLNRVQRKCMSTSDITATVLPQNCELYVVDSIVDPEDFANPISFKDTHIFVARAYGLHTSTVAPREYFNQVLTALLTMEREFKLAFVGPFGGDSNVPLKERYNAIAYARAFISQHKKDLKTSTIQDKTPICLNSNDVALDFAIGPGNFTDGGHRFIWYNSNRQRIDRFKMLVGRYTKCSTSHYSTISQTSETAVYDNLRLAYTDDDFTTGSRLLFNTEQANKAIDINEILPLAVVNTIITVYIRLSLSTHAWAHHFKKRFPSLIEFNKHATRCALEIYPSSLFSSDPAVANQLKVRATQLFTPLRTQYLDKISYGHQPKTQRFQGSLTDANFSMPVTTKPKVKQPLMDIQNTKPTSSLKRTASQNDYESQTPPSKKVDRKPEPFLSFMTKGDVDTYISQQIAIALANTKPKTPPLENDKTDDKALMPPPKALTDKYVAHFLDEQGRETKFVSCGSPGGSTATITKLNKPSSPKENESI